MWIDHTVHYLAVRVRQVHLIDCALKGLRRTRGVSGGCLHVVRCRRWRFSSEQPLLHTERVDLAHALAQQHKEHHHTDLRPEELHQIVADAKNWRDLLHHPADHFTPKDTRPSRECQLVRCIVLAPDKTKRTELLCRQQRPCYHGQRTFLSYSPQEPEDQHTADDFANE